MGDIKPIETIYNGYRFRSRLEARWAVFLDTLGVPYRYEPEGFELTGGLRYLPDFWLPTLDAWMEIKPDVPTQLEERKARLLALQGGKDVYIVVGDPWLPSRIRDLAEGHIDITVGGYWAMVWLGYARDYLGAGENDRDHKAWQECANCGAFSLGEIAGHTGSDQPCCDAFTPRRDTARLVAAYAAARQARFEHGETPQAPQ